MFLRDPTNETVKTNSNGQAVSTQLPAAIYTFHVTVPYGIPSTTTQTISSGGGPPAQNFTLPQKITPNMPPPLKTTFFVRGVAGKKKKKEKEDYKTKKTPPPLRA